MSEIVNRVSESGLLTLDLENFVSSNEIVEVDIAEQLWQGLALKEKDFREWIKTNDWSIFKDKNVYIHCSVDAIIPSWAYMLIASSLVPFTDSFIAGSKVSLEERLIKENISKIDLEELQDKRVVIKGCSDVTSPNFGMVEIVKHIQPVVKSIMFGEPCSTVPIYKKKK